MKHPGSLGIALATMLALGGNMSGAFGRSWSKGSKTNCAVCNIKIPPGKAGRKCEKCRQQPKGTP